MKPRPERRGNWNAPARTTGLAIILVIMTVSQTAGAATSLWWDLGYDFRRNIAVTTGANTPDKGYDGYTVRDATLDTQSLITAGQMQTNCNDLRILYFDGLSWTELPRHLIGCNTAATDIRFRLPVNLAASSVNDNFYVYHGNTAAGPPASLTTTNVYLWFDNASTDRSTSYVRGRIDPWHGTGWDNSLTWNPAGYYTHDNGDNFTSGYRLGLDERDVYVESEFFHTSCYPFNITTGVLLRGIVASGTGGSETSDHYYASNRGEYPGCHGVTAES